MKSSKPIRKGQIEDYISNSTQNALNLKQNLSEKGQINGYASLDSGGKVPISQLPNSVMEYKGNYNASTNTPTLIDGVGDAGDVYRVSVAGTGVNGISFVVGDYVIYSGTTWEKSHSGADNVTSVFGRQGVVIAQTGDYDTSLIPDTANRRYQTDNQKLFNDATSSIQTQLNSKVNKSGDTMTGSLTSTAFIKIGGSSSQFLKADGSSDSNVYLTTESDTLQTVTNRGTLTTLSITTNGFIKSGGTSSQFLKADGSIDSTVYAIDSNVMHLSGNETFTGTKSSTITTSASAISVTNNTSGTNSSGISITNNNSSTLGFGLSVNNNGASGGVGINVVNQGTTGIGASTNNTVTNSTAIAASNSSTNGSAFAAYNTSSGKGMFIRNQGTGYGLYITNEVAGVNNAIVIDNATVASSKPFQYTKNSVEKAFLNDAGNFSAQAIIKAGGTSNDILLADGSTVNKNSLSELRVSVSDANYTISGTNNFLIAYTSITAPRSVFLPVGTTLNQRVWITDESGLASATRSILVVPNGTDTIGGDTFAAVTFPNGSGYFESNGAGKWNIISTTSIQFSAGVNTAPTVTDNGNGTVILGAGIYALFANTNGVGRPKAYSIAGGTFTLTDNNTNFIYAEYDTALGTVSLKQTNNEVPLNDLTQVLVYAAYRQGTTLHSRNFDNWGIALSNKLNRSIYRTQRVRFEEGSITLNESATPAVRTITIAGGTVWIAANEQTLSALTSAANTCYHVIQTSPGVWNTTTVVTQYNNTQYNDTTTGLQTLANNQYGINWVYRSVGLDNDMAIVLGSASYTLGAAQVASKPSNLPPFLRHMEIIGRIIVKKGDNTATQIDNVSTSLFTAAGVTDHEALLNLQGGTVGEHYHLTSAQRGNIINPASASQNGYLTSADWNTFNSGGRPYTVYTALVTQSGTSAPTVKILENTTGLTITPSYTSVGTYAFTYSAAQNANKLFTIISDNNTYSGSPAGAARGMKAGTNSFTITTAIIGLTGTMTDGLLNDTSISLRIYP